MSEPIDGPFRRVALQDLDIEMSVGLKDWERKRRQTVRVSVDMWAPLGRGPFERLDQCIDYDRVHAHIAGTWPARPHTDLLETLADELLAFVLEDPQVQAARVTLAKPEVYPGAATPAVTFFRRQGD